MLGHNFLKHTFCKMIVSGQALFYGKFYLVNRWYFKSKILSFLKLNESISYLTYFFITTFVRTSRKKLVPPKGSLPFFS